MIKNKDQKKVIKEMKLKSASSCKPQEHNRVEDRISERADAISD